MNHNIKVLPLLLTGYGRVSLSLIWPECVDVWHQSNCTQWRFFYGHLPGRTFIWHYQQSAALWSARPDTDWKLKDCSDIFRRLGTSKPSCTNSHPQGIFFHEKFQFAFIFNFFLFLLWVHPMRSILNSTGKTKKKINVSICEAPGTTSLGSKSSPWGGIGGSLLPRSSREHLRRVTKEISCNLGDLMRSGTSKSDCTLKPVLIK